MAKSFREWELIEALLSVEGASTPDERRQAAAILYLWVLAEASWFLIVPIETRAEVAEDIAADITMEKLVGNKKVRMTVIGAQHPRAYVRRMIERAICDRFRNRKEARHRQCVPLSQVCEPSFRELETYLGMIEAADQVSSLREHLSDEEQDLLAMRYWEDLSIEKIAERLEIRYSAAAQRLFRLQNKVREMLVGEEVER